MAEYHCLGRHLVYNHPLDFKACAPRELVYIASGMARAYKSFPSSDLAHETMQLACPAPPSGPQPLVRGLPAPSDLRWLLAQL